MAKKVVFFHPYFSFGGVEKTNIRIAKFLLSKGFLVDFLVINCSPHLREEIKQNGIEIITLDVKRTINAIFSIRKYLKKEYKINNITFISCQNYANIIAIITVLFLRRNIKLIISERNHPSEFDYKKKSIKTWILLFLMRKLYRFSDIIVANSIETAKDLEQIVNKKVKSIYNPTLTENYEKLSMDIVEKQWFYEEVPIIISVGRLSEQKDFKTLIKAFEKVKNEIDCRLVILGEGEKREELENLIRQLNIENYVWMPGYKKNPYKYIKKSTVFVLSSLYEGLPNVLIEALALKVPCISTNCKSGPKEILLNGEGGNIVEVSNVQEMSAAIIDTISNLEIAKIRMEKAFNELYKFTPEEVGKKYLEVIES